MSRLLGIKEKEITRMELLQEGPREGLRSPEPHGHRGTFLVGFGKPSPNFDSSNEGRYFHWSRKVVSWAVTNTSDDVITETSDPGVLQGPNSKGQKDLDYRFETARTAVTRGVYDGISNVMSNSFSLYKIYDIASLSLAIAVVCRNYVSGDIFDKQAYQREYVNAHMKGGGDPTLYVEEIGIIEEKLSQVGIPKSDQKANLHLVQRLTSEVVVDKSILQCAPNLTHEQNGGPGTHNIPGVGSEKEAGDRWLGTSLGSWRRRCIRWIGEIRRFQELGGHYRRGGAQADHQGCANRPGGIRCRHRGRSICTSGILNRSRRLWHRGCHR